MQNVTKTTEGWRFMCLQCKTRYVNLSDPKHQKFKPARWAEPTYARPEACCARCNRMTVERQAHRYRRFARWMSKTHLGAIRPLLRISRTDNTPLSVWKWCEEHKMPSKICECRSGVLMVLKLCSNQWDAWPISVATGEEIYIRAEYDISEKRLVSEWFPEDPLPMYTSGGRWYRDQYDEYLGRCVAARRRVVEARRTHDIELLKECERTEFLTGLRKDALNRRQKVVANQRLDKASMTFFRTLEMARIVNNASRSQMKGA